MELQLFLANDNGNVDESCLDNSFQMIEPPKGSQIESKTKFSLTKNLFNYAKLQKKAKYVFVNK